VARRRGEVGLAPSLGLSARVGWWCFGSHRAKVLFHMTAHGRLLLMEVASPVPSQLLSLVSCLQRRSYRIS